MEQDTESMNTSASESLTTEGSGWDDDRNNVLGIEYYESEIEELSLPDTSGKYQSINPSISLPNVHMVADLLGAYSCYNIINSYVKLTTTSKHIYNKYKTKHYG